MFKSKDVDLVDFSFSLFQRDVTREERILFYAPLSLTGMESGGVVVEAMAAVLRAVALAEKSKVLFFRADSILETVLERQALAKDRSCCFVYFMEFIVAAWGWMHPVQGL